MTVTGQAAERLRVVELGQDVQVTVRNSHADSWSVLKSPLKTLNFRAPQMGPCVEQP